MAVRVGFEPTHRYYRPNGLANRPLYHLSTALCYGGRPGIRTLGPFQVASFQDLCNKPDSTNRPYYPLYTVQSILTSPMSYTESLYIDGSDAN